MSDGVRDGSDHPPSITSEGVADNRGMALDSVTFEPVIAASMSGLSSSASARVHVCPYVGECALERVDEPQRDQRAEQTRFIRRRELPREPRYYSPWRTSAPGPRFLSSHLH